MAVPSESAPSGMAPWMYVVRGELPLVFLWSSDQIPRLLAGVGVTTLPGMSTSKP